MHGLCLELVNEAVQSERLMEQLGYLEDDGDRMGMLDSQRLRMPSAVLAEDIPLISDVTGVTLPRAAADRG